MTNNNETFDRFWKRATIAVFIFMGIAFIIVIILFIWVKKLESEKQQAPENPPPAISQ